ncbi:hypothetical protein C6989_09130 [Nitrosopumilus sp. b2]|nr:hypothetical protein C6989_09130 [Nitrosopumilus sp. b2]
MDILMGIVIAFIIVVAGFVGYHASQQVDDAEGHDMKLEIQSANENENSLQIQNLNYQNPSPKLVLH